MKLFHVSEEAHIDSFVPRHPKLKEASSPSLVWAINTRCLPNYLTPRDCPRVTYHAHKASSSEDIASFFISSARHCVAIEFDWYKMMTKTSLYLYELDPSNFYLYDEVAGYYVSEQIEYPLSMTRVDDPFAQLFSRNVEIRILPNLRELANSVQQSTLNWSFIRMINAKP